MLIQWPEICNQMQLGKEQLWGYRQGDSKSSAEGGFLPKPCCGGPSLLCAVPPKTRFSNTEGSHYVLFLWLVPRLTPHHVSSWTWCGSVWPTGQCRVSWWAFVVGRRPGQGAVRWDGNDTGDTACPCSRAVKQSEVQGCVAFNTQLQLLCVLGSSAVSLPQSIKRWIPARQQSSTDVPLL